MTAGLRLLTDVFIGAIFLTAMLVLAYMPPDIVQRSKRGGWLVMDVLFQAAVSGVMAFIHGWEKIMDTYWRIRCRVRGKPLRPY